MASRICYPPITYSSLPAFPAGTDLMFRFNIPNLNAKNDIKSIQFVVNFQTNNKSAVRREQWHTDIIFIPWSSVREDSLGYYVYIGSDNLTNGWEAGLYYRIQARFGLIEGPEQVGFNWEEWAEWSQYAAENNLLTEWSTVTIVKAITRPTVSIINLTDSSAEAGNQFVSSSLSTFVGAYYSSDPQEIVDTYRFVITDQNGAIVADSGEQHHNSADDYYIVEYVNDGSEISSIDIYNPEIYLNDGETYHIEYTITTKNLYTDTASYDFTIQDNYSGAPAIYVTAQVDNENGKIDIYFNNVNSGDLFRGNFVIKRTSNQTNYDVWEDLVTLQFSSIAFNNTLVYQDYFVEHGVTYRYGVQQIYNNQTRSYLVTEEEDDRNSYYTCLFNYSYLYSNGKQLTLKFNDTVDSFAQTHLESVQQAMGSVYPFITRNGITSYYQFPVDGLISYHQDDMEQFLSKDSTIFPYSVTRTRVDDNEPLFTPNTNLTNQNIYTERKFREAIMEFLYSGDYFLYKSQTEGNILVVLTGISLTPNSTVHRMIYSFSSQAYQIDEYSLSTLVRYGVYDPGEFEQEAYETVSQLGQVIVNSETTNVYEEIRAQQNTSAGEGYEYQLASVDSLWIEPMDESVEYVTVKINGVDILIHSNRIYTLKDVDVNSISVIDNTDCIINYTCSVQIVDTVEDTLLSSYIYREQGQLRGTFSETNISEGSDHTHSYSSLDLGNLIFEDAKSYLSQVSGAEYDLMEISSITIDAQPNTELLVNNNSVFVGPTGIYEVTGASITSLSFVKPTYAVVNYNCRIRENVYGEPTP